MTQMIALELRSPVVEAVLELVAASSIREQAEILTLRDVLFLTEGADGALAALCQLYRNDHNFVLRLEAMRISLYGVRQQLDDPSQVAPNIRHLLPFGGPDAPIQPAADEQLDIDTQVIEIVWAYVSAGAWRVRHGIAAAFPALFGESGIALDVVTKMRTIDGAERMPEIETAFDYLMRAHTRRTTEQPRGLTGARWPSLIRTPVLPMFTEAEIIELSVWEYQECRSTPTRAELLQDNPALLSEHAAEYSELLAAHHRRYGRADTAEAYDSVARSLAVARTGRLDEAAAMVRDIGYLPTKVQVRRMLEARATGDLRTVVSLARHGLHLSDQQLVPRSWASLNMQLAQLLAEAPSQVAGPTAVPFIIEEILFRCLAALSRLMVGTDAWTDTCIILAEALVDRSRGNRTANLEAATAILAEVTEVGRANKRSVPARLRLAMAYCELFGDSATENLGLALQHARQALAIYEVTGDRSGVSYARMTLARVLVRVADEVRGQSRMELLDSAEEHLSQCDFPPAQTPTPERDDAMITYLAQVLGLGPESETARTLRAGVTETSLPTRVLVLQLRAICKVLRYSDGTPDLTAQLDAVELHREILDQMDRDIQPKSWAGTMFSLANSYTRYPEPTDTMLQCAEEALRAALAVFRAQGADYQTGQVTKALGDIAFRRHRWDEAATSLRKAASIFAEGEEWSTSDRGVLAQLSELRDTYARLSYALHRSGRPAPECLEWLERGKTRLTAEHGRSFFEFGELAAAVPVQGAVVVPLVTSQGSLLWTITRKPDGTPLLATAELDNLTDTGFDGVLHGSDTSPSWVRAYNAFLRSSDKTALQTWAATIDHVCHELWRLVGAEIEASLQTAGVAEGAPVAIAPPRQLAILPLHAAWRPNQDGTRHYLCDNYTITYTPSLRALTTATALRQVRASTAPSLLAIANPTGDLPHAAAEADSIARYFPDGRRAVLYGDAATKDQIITQASRHTYLHITCHGSFNSDNPSQSSLYLADGPARLDELRSLLPLEKFDLITLSACETGLLDYRRAPYEWLGIAGSLTRAGATDIICTLWSIDDMATAQLMNHFYRSLIGERIPPAQALQRAQKAIRNEPDLRHPFYWAAFMHVGVPRQAD